MLCLENLKKIKHYQFFHSKIGTGNECDKQLKLGNLVFDEENHEQRSWKFLDVCVIDLCHFSCLSFLS